MIRLQVDFNNFTEDGERIIIGTKDVGVEPGERVVIYQPYEFEVEAIIEFEKEEESDLGWWYAKPDWSTRRDFPDPPEQQS